MRIADTVQITTPSEREIAITRTFDAPRALVFEAFTTPELLKRWFFGPDGWTLEVCDIDLRAGGRYRYVWRRDSDGTRMGMGGVYREVVAPERVVATEKFDEAWYPGEALDTMVFTEQGGGTLFRQTVLYESREARDIAIRSNMEEGLRAGYNRLERLLASA